MTKDELSPDDLKAIDLYFSSSHEDRLKLMRKKNFKRLAAKVQNDIASTPGLGEELVRIFGITIPEKDVEAAQFMIYGLERILSRPEVRQSEVVTKALEAVYSSVAGLTTFQLDEEAILKAFAAPSISLTNSKTASRPRSPEANRRDARSMFVRWAADPTKYKSINAFGNDCLRSEFVNTLTTATSWAKAWIKELPESHVLREKYKS